tara:strand:+ start:472 stop:1404 length:933 start_codon:yes stop_codon:yes gene_type:complete
MQPPAWASQTAMSLFLHPGKRRLHADPARLDELAAQADVVIIEAPTADAALEFGFEHWSTPVKVVITPFGLTGPKRNWHATPSTLLAMGGYSQIVGDAGRAPLSLPGHYVEFQGAQFAYTAANGCRFAGESNTVDISLYESLLSLSQFTTVMWSCAKRVRSRHGSDFYWVVPSNLFACADGWVYINTVPTFWDAMTTFLELPELIIDSRFADNDLRMQHRDALHELIAQALATVSKAEIRERSIAARIPAGVVLTFDEVLEDEHLAERDFWQSINNGDGRDYRAPGLGFCIDGRARAPMTLRKVELDGSL